MKHILPAILILLTTIVSVAQSDYYATDSTVMVGVTIIDQGDIKNAQTCMVKKDKKFLQFTPYEVTEYKVGRKIYFSKEIEINGEKRRVFLQRLVNDSTSLFYYRARGITLFYIQRRGEALTELPRRKSVNGKQTYRDILFDHTQNCSYSAENLKVTSYRQRDLAEFIKHYNSCNPQPISFRSFGVMAGFSNLLTFVPGHSKSELTGSFGYQYQPAFSLGIFMDQPLYRNHYSLYLALSLVNRSESQYVRKDYTDLDLLTNSITLELPFMLRYRLKPGRLSPFVGAGGIIGHDLRNETRIYQTHFNNDIITIEDTGQRVPAINPQIGFSVGTGLDFSFNIRNKLTFELRYSIMSSAGKNDSNSVLLGRQGFQIFTGINF